MGFVCPLFGKGTLLNFLGGTLLLLKVLQCLGVDVPGGDIRDPVRENAFIARHAGIAFGARFTLDGFGCEDFPVGSIAGKGANDVARLRSGSAGSELGSDLQAVEIEAGALAIEVRRIEGAEDLREGHLNALGVFERGEKERLFDLASGGGGAIKAAVVITEGLIFEGGRFTPGPAGHDVTALIEHNPLSGSAGRGRRAPLPPPHGGASTPPPRTLYESSLLTIT